MRIGILTGGGDCPGLNAAIRAAVMRADDYGDEVVGIRRGWAGLIDGEIEPLDLHTVDEIISRGGTILSTSRVNPFKKEAEDVPKLMENVKKFGLDAIIAVGGEDTLGVALKLQDMGLPCVGVPKTMDNDVRETDFCFGFDSAVTVAVDAIERLRDTAKSHHRIMVLEVMGRHAGWVALYTGLASGADWILIPEVKPDLDEMCAHLKKDYARKKYGIVVVSEGVEVPGIPEVEEKVDAHGHPILMKRGVGQIVGDEIENRTGIETRVAVIGHIQRGGSPTVFDRVLATRLAIKAVDLIKQNKYGYMAALKGDTIGEVPLKQALPKDEKGKTMIKTVPQEWYDQIKTFLK